MRRAAAADGRPPRPRPWLRAAEGLAVLVLLIFVARYLVRHWAEVRAYPWDVAPGPLAAATAAAALSMAIGCWIWAAIVRAVGEPLAWRDAPKVYFVSALARYIPGKVWQPSGMAYLAQRRGVHALHAVAASFLLQVLVVAVGLLLFVGTVPARAAALGGVPGEIAVAAAAAVLVVLYLSPAFERLYARMLRLVGRPAAIEHLPVARKAVFGVAAIALWILWGLSFWLFLEATAGRHPSVPAAIGICAGGYVGGFLAFFSPGGLGVRESLYALLLQPYVPASVALALALLNRVWLTTIEVALTLLATVLAGRGLPGGKTSNGSRAVAARAAAVAPSDV